LSIENTHPAQYLATLSREPRYLRDTYTMSLFGDSPPNDSPSFGDSSIGQSRNSLFDDEGPLTRSTSDTLFNDDDLGSGRASPWDMPTPRKQQSRADLIRSLLAGVDVPDSYVEAFDHVVRDDGNAGMVSPAGVSKTLAAAKLAADQQARVMSILAPSGEEMDLNRDAFNVLLALVGLAQEGELVSLDGVDERRRSKSFILMSVPACP
jgi:sorting nexin-8